MAPLIPSPRQPLELESFVCHTPVARARCRAQALLGLDDGDSAERVAESLHSGRRTVYDRVERSHDRSAFGLRRRLADAPRPGRPRAAGGGGDSRIAPVMDTDPRDLGYDATVRTAPLLVRYRRDHHATEVSRKAVSRAIARPGIRWERPRYQPAPRPEARRQAEGG